MDLLYGEYSYLATGGAIGDALFFFISGFTIFLGRDYKDFGNYYKRRINRIYPTVFAWATISSIFLHHNKSFIDILITGGSWFVSCIMIYYVFLYFTSKTSVFYNYRCLSRVWAQTFKDCDYNWKEVFKIHP